MEKKTQNAKTPRNAPISPMVIKRLPRYYRYLREVIRDGRSRISSSELSERMNVTASQIRQDLNCFGEFGQQGYGYNVTFLYAKICELLGVSEGYSAIVIGAGNLGKALVRNPMFEKRGVEIAAMFDVSPQCVGEEVAGVRVRDMKELDEFCANNVVDIAVLTLPKENAEQIAAHVIDLGIMGIWNFTGKELDRIFPQAVIKNVHIGDSLMTLCYELHKREEQAGC